MSTIDQHRTKLSHAITELVNDDALTLPATIDLLEEVAEAVRVQLDVAREAADRQESEGGA